MRTLAVLILLAGCASEPLAPKGTDYVSVSSGSGFIGRSTDWIYANDTLRREDQEPNQTEPTVKWQQLPEGTYAAIRNILEDGVPTITAPEFELCPTDMGVNAISFSQPIAGDGSVSAGGMDNVFSAVRSDVMALLPPR